MINKQKVKVIVVGLDGGSWNIIKPLVEQGKLPTIEKIMKNGVCGNLESSIPPITCPAWKCYSTGKNPGKLGVYFWKTIDMEKEKFIIHNSTSFKSKEIWDYLSNESITCGVLGMPTTYPPKNVNGFMVSEFNLTNYGYTYPKDLEKELTELFDYVGEYSAFQGKDRDLVIQDRKDLIKQRFDAFRHLLKKFNPDFCHITIFHIDNIQHFYWGYMEDNDPKYGKAIEESWVLIDNELKKLLEDANYNFNDKSDIKGENTYVILMSDHGFTKTKIFFNVSQWLIRKGYLVLHNPKSPSKSLLYSTFSAIVSRLPILIETTIKLKRLPSIKNILYHAPKRIKGVMTDSLINWEKSKILPILGGPLYINKKLMSAKEYQIFRDKVIEEIKDIKNQDTGEKMAKKVYKKEDIYSGEYFDSAPDIIILPTDGVIPACEMKEKRLWHPPGEEGWSGTHVLHGIFCISGPNIKKNQEIQNARIIDLVPTILHIFSLPIQNDIDGRVLTECFEEDSELAKRGIKYKDISEKSKIKDKIKSLKSLGKV